MDFLGQRLRQARLNAGLTMRELAREADVSPSLISQIENGKSQPSVATLYAFSRLLGVSVDELFEADEQAAPEPVLHVSAAASSAGSSVNGHGFVDPAHAWRPSEYATRISVVHPSHRSRLAMAEGVEWERLAATPEQGVNFMRITYAPGASSSAQGDLQAHDAYEYGYVLSGQVQVTVGEEEFSLHEGESLGFDSTIPHVLRNDGAVDFVGLWFVHGHHH